MKRDIFKRVMASALALLMVVSSIPVDVFGAPSEAEAQTEADTKEGIEIIEMVADPSTIDKWKPMFETDDDFAASGEVGQIATDKTVFAGDAPSDSDSGKGHGEIKRKDPNNFLVGLSAISSHKEIFGQEKAPVDVMIILDFSNSMGATGIRELIVAANEALRDLFNDGMNEYNRVGVVSYGNSNATQVILPLDTYDATKVKGGWFTRYNDGDFIYCNAGTSMSDQRIQVCPNLATSTGKAVSSPVAGGVVPGGATPTQAGLISALNQFKKATDTWTVTTAGDKERLPFVVLMSDGVPTYGYQDFKNEPSSTDKGDYGSGSINARISPCSFATQLSAAYLKSELDDKYNKTPMFYSLGYKVSGITTDNSAQALATSVLNSSVYNKILDDYWTEYNKPGDYMTLSDKLVEKDPSIVPYRDYTDKYFPSEGDGLKGAFAEIIAEIELQSRYNVTTTGDDKNHTGYVSMHDDIGEYMEVKGVNALVYNDNTYTGAAFAQTAVALFDGYDDLKLGVIEGFQDMWAKVLASKDEAAIDFVKSIVERLNIVDKDGNEAVALHVMFAALDGGKLYYKNKEDFGNVISWYSEGKGEDAKFVRDYYVEWETDTTATYVNEGHFFIADVMTGDNMEGGGEVEPLEEDVSLGYISAFVQTALDDKKQPFGAQELYFGIPASLIPIQLYHLELDGDTIEGSNQMAVEVDKKHPVHLFYEVGLKDEITKYNVDAMVKNDYKELFNEDGQYKFYSNLWGYDTAYAETETRFTPSKDNEFYYYYRDLSIYIGEDNWGNNVIKDKETGKVKKNDSHWNGEELNLNAGEKLYTIASKIPNTSSAKGTDGKYIMEDIIWYYVPVSQETINNLNNIKGWKESGDQVLIKKGTPRFASLEDFSYEKEENPTGTNEYYRQSEAWTNVDDVYSVKHGNNGYLLFDNAESGQVIIGKDVVDEGYTDKDEFIFEITLSDWGDDWPTANVIVGFMQDEEGGYTQQRNAEFAATDVKGVYTGQIKLKNGERAKLVGLKPGSKIEIEELLDDPGDWKLRRIAVDAAADGKWITSRPDKTAQGVIYVTDEESDVPEIIFRNIKDDSWEVQVTKESSVGSMVLGGEEFDFTAKLGGVYDATDITLKIGDTTITPEIVNDEFTFTLKIGETAFIGGKSAETEVTITEVDGELAGWEFDKVSVDPTSWTVEDTTVSGTMDYGEGVAIVYTNKRDMTGELTVTKTVEEETASPQVFDFILKLTGAPDYREALTVSVGTPETLTYDEEVSGYKFSLKNNEKIVITNLPVGITYTLEEVGSYGYESQIPEYSGVISSEGETIDVTNIYSLGQLHIQKHVKTEGIAPDDEFTFTITLENAEMGVEQSYPASWIDRAGNKTENDLTFTDGVATIKLKDGEEIFIKDIYKGTTYQVVEDDYSAAGYETIASGDVGEITINGRAIALFVNEYAPVVDEFGSLEVTKIVDGDGIPADWEFEFIIEFSDGTNETFKLDKANPSKQFDDIAAGTGYTITEIDGTEIENEKIETEVETEIEDVETEDAETEESETEETETEGTETEKAEIENVQAVLMDDEAGAVGTGKYFLTGAVNEQGTIVANEIISASFTNTYGIEIIEDEFGDLRITKTVDGDEDWEFDFEITFSDGNNDTFKLNKANPSVVYKDLPTGTTYTIKEVLSDEFTLISSENSSGSIVQAGVEVAAGFVNKPIVPTEEIPDPEPGQLQITKLIVGDSDGADKSFEFTVTVNGAPYNGPAIDHTGTIVTIVNGTFELKDGQWITIDGLAVGSTYEVVEKDYSDEMYEATISNPSGVILADVGIEALVANRRDELYPGTLEITKEVTGNGGQETDEFTFNIVFTNPINATFDTLDGEGNSGTITFVDGVAETKLKHNQSIQILGIPAKAEYKVTEDEFVIHYPYDTTSNGDEGIIPEAGVVTAEFINHREIPTAEDPHKTYDSSSVIDSEETEVAVGDEIVYNISYVNHHIEDTTVTIIDKLDPGVDFEEASNGGKYDEDEHLVRWVLEDIEEGSRGSVTVKVTVNSSAVGVVENKATVQIGNDDAVETETLENPLAPEDPHKTYDASSAITSEETEVAVGDEIVYNISYKNHKDKEVTVIITDKLDEGLEYISSSPNGDYDKGEHTVTWTLTAKAGEANSVTLVTKVTDQAVEVVANQAFVSIDNDVAIGTEELENPVEPDPEEPHKTYDASSAITSEETEVAVGDEIVYNISYKNHKDKKATVTITDKLDEGLEYISSSPEGSYDAKEHTVTWTIENVAAHAEDSVTLVTKVTDQAVEVVANQAFVSIDNDVAIGTEELENPVEPDPEEPHKTYDASSAITSEETEVAVGDEIVYNISYKNHKNKAVTVTITDKLDEGLEYISSSPEGTYDAKEHTVTWTIEGVAAHAEDSVTLVTKVTDQAVEVVANQAFVSIDNDVAIGTEELENPVEPDPEAPHKTYDADSVVTSEGEEVAVDDEIIYNISYKNHKAKAVTIKITDTLDDGLDYVSSTPEGKYDEASRTITWTISDVGAREAGSVTLVTKVNDKAVKQVKNKAFVSVDNEDAKETEELENPVEPDPETPHKTYDAGSEVTSEETEVAVGDEIVYNISYENHKAKAATITITDKLDDGLSYVGSSPEGFYNISTHTVVWTLTDIAAHEKGAVTLVTRVNNQAVEQVKNKATVRIDNGDDKETEELENPVEPDPDKPHKSYDEESEIVKNDEVSVDDEIIYNISYSNHTAKAADITIKDTLDVGVDFVEASDGGTYSPATRTVTWTLEKIKAQTEGIVSVKVKVNENAFDKVTNKATVQVGNGAEIDTNELENPVEPDPDKPHKSYDEESEIVKNDEVSVDDEIIYNISYRNHTAKDADITIKDTLDVGVDFVEASDGGTYSPATRTVTWKLEDIEAQTEGIVSVKVKVNENAFDRVTNKATVQVGNGAEIDTNELENPVEPDPDKPHKSYNEESEIVKNDEVSVDDEIIYNISYSNHTAKAADIIIRDTLDVGVDFVEASDGGTYSPATRTVTWTLEKIKAQTEGIVSVKVKVNENAFDKVTNKATVQVGNGAEIDTNELENPVEPDPDKPHKSYDEESEIVKNDEVSVDDEIIYNISYRNHTAKDADITIKDTLDVGVDFVEASDGGTYSPATRTVTWKLEDIEAQTEGIVSVKVKVNENAFDRVTNKATVQVGNGVEIDTNELENPVEPDPDKPHKSYNEESEIVKNDEVSVDDEIIYNISYSNHTAKAADIIIRDTLDVGVDFVEASDGGTYSPATRTVTWKLEKIKAQTEGIVSVKVKVNENAFDKVTNKATVQVGNGAEIDTNELENPVEPDPDKPHKSYDEESEIVKNDEVSVDDEIIYNISYRNHTAKDADITIKDTLDVGVDFVEASDGGTYSPATRTVTWKLEDIEAQTEGIVSVKVKVNENAFDKVTNKATVQVGNGVEIDTNELENPVEPDPDKPHKSYNEDSEIVKNDEVEVGDTIVYNISYKNHTAKAVDVIIKDTLNAGVDFVDASVGHTYDDETKTVSWNIKAVAAQEEGIVTVTVKVNEDAVDKVTNKATVQVGNGVEIDTNELENPVEPEPETPEKSYDESSEIGADDEVAVGDTIVYNISYKNHKAKAADVIIKDTLNAGVDFVDASAGYTYDDETKTVSWNFEAVAAHEEGIVTVTVRVNENAVDKVTNKATVQVGNGAEIDTNELENPVEPEPETPEKSYDESSEIGADDEVAVGDTIVYNISYKNHKAKAADVIIKDTLNKGVDFVDASEGYTYDDETNTVSWNIEAVAAQAEGLVTVTVKVNENAVDKVTNKATVQVGNGAVIDTNELENPVEPDPDKPQKTYDESSEIGVGDEVAVGDKVVYNISYKNNSSEEAKVVITDKLDKGFTYVAASEGASYDKATHTVTWNLQAPAKTEGVVTVTVTVNDQASDKVVNSAIVQVGNDPEQNTNELENPVEPDPEAPRKSYDESSKIGAGDEVEVGNTIVYNISYKNHKSKETTVTITDKLDKGFTYVAASDGASYDEKTHTVTWNKQVPAKTKGSVTVTVKVNDKASKQVVNTAIVKIGDDPEQKTNELKNTVKTATKKPSGGTVNKPGTSNGTAKTTSSKVVKTGDTSGIIFYGIILVIAAGLAVAILISRKKKIRR